MKQISIIGAIALTLFLFDLLFIGNYTAIISSVDGNTIRYIDHTSFDEALAWGVQQWNMLGGVQIARDDRWSWADLEFRDYTNCYDYLDAYWQPDIGTDTIAFNTCRMSVSSVFGQKQITVHEIGHGLGLKDYHDSQWKNLTIMYYCARCTDIITPQQHDINNYFLLWP